MEIYILREGKETGPFSEVTTQMLLKQGSVLIGDLAWSPGMGEWMPLHSVLYPAPTAPSLRPPPPPPPQAVVLTPQEPRPHPPHPLIKPAAETVDREPATARQKAFLTYMGVAFSPELSKEQAALAVNDTMESPSDPQRLARWNEERLRLHPELYAAEAQVKKESRAGRYFETAQNHESGEFKKVSKAHCQVLMGYLDTRFPNWDADEAAAEYFFAAVCEKFPQLVAKSAKGRHKFPQSRKVSAELKQSHATPRKVPVAVAVARPSPVDALVRGLVFGLLILAVFFIGNEFLKSGKPKAAQKAAPPAAVEPVGVEPRRPAPPIEVTPEPKPEPVAAVSVPPAPETVAVPVTPPAHVAEEAPPVALEPVPTVEPGTVAAVPVEMPATSAEIPAVPPVIPAERPAARVPAVPAVSKFTALITKAVQVQLPFGMAEISPGTLLPIVSNDGKIVKVRYGSNVISIPISSTNQGVVPGAPAPATAPTTAPATAPATEPTPAAPADSTPSLF